MNGVVSAMTGSDTTLPVAVAGRPPLADL